MPPEKNIEWDKRQKADLNELFILDIMREEMENDDPRLFWRLFE